MKAFAKIIVALITCVVPIAVGCGPKNTEPKAINVKEDPRVKPAVEGKGQKTEGALP